MHFRRWRCKKKVPPAESAGETQSQETSTHPAPALEPEHEQPGQEALSAPSLQSPPPTEPSKDTVQVSDSKCQDVTAHAKPPEMDPALMALWVKIQERVQQIAVREKKTVNENLELEDFIENVEKKEPRKRDKAKAIFGNTLTVIGKVGGMVADAASQVNHPQIKSSSEFTIILFGRLSKSL